MPGHKKCTVLWQEWRNQAEKYGSPFLHEDQVKSMELIIALRAEIYSLLQMGRDMFLPERRIDDAGGSRAAT